MCSETLRFSFATLLARFARNRSGVAAIEFALVFPVLAIFTIGTYGAGFAMHRISSVNYALDQTARVLQLNPTITAADLQATINAKLATIGREPVSVSLSVATDGSGSSIGHLTALSSFDLHVPMLEAYHVSYSRTANVFLSIPQ